MSNSKTLPLPELTEVMVTAELFACVKECHAAAAKGSQHMNVVRVEGSFKIMNFKEFQDIEKSSVTQLVYSTDRGFVFTPLAGELAYG